MKGVTMNTKRSSNKRTLRSSVLLESLKDDVLSDAAGAGTSKVKASEADSLPRESLSLSFSRIEVAYT
jgi:hypothetical protein